MSEPVPMTVIDQESASRAILELLLQYPDYPKDFIANQRTILFNTISDEQSIGIFPLTGAIYLSRYVSGSYTGQMPFEIVYKSSPTKNSTMLKAQELLEKLGLWLEKCNIAFTDIHMELESLVRTSPVFAVSQNEKETQLGQTFRLVYSFKK